MTHRAHWDNSAGPIDTTATSRLFFTDHEWDTVKAAVDRIIPADELTPSASEAGVVLYIDRYLSPGLEYIYATNDGSGFMKLTGRWRSAWAERIADLQTVYRDGIKDLDKLARERAGAEFKALPAEKQDFIIELLSHAPKPQEVVLGESLATGSFLQAFNDDGLAFLDCLILHTRQGYYGDPAYGGNQGQAGWRSIGFPGPKSLKDTVTMEYSIRHLYQDDQPWEDLIPYLREKV